MNSPKLWGFRSETSLSTSNYTKESIGLTYTITGSNILCTYNLVAYSTLTYATVNAAFQTGFRIWYPNGSNGSIGCEKPQPLQPNNALTASPSPIPSYTLSVGTNSDWQYITLKNNSTATCNILSNAVLRGYTTANVHLSSLTIPANSAETLSLRYYGTMAGRFDGYVDILTDLGNLTLFTKVNVGSATPESISITTSTGDLISQDFVIDPAIGEFKSFTVTNFVSDSGYSLTQHVGGTHDTFNVTFDPSGVSNGVYTATTNVQISPLDSSQNYITWSVPMSVTLNVPSNVTLNSEPGIPSATPGWSSARLGSTSTEEGRILHLRYDILKGRRYLTAGIGIVGTAMHGELSEEELVCASWEEVYRFEQTTDAPQYSRDHIVKSPESFLFTDWFGVGLARGSLLTVKWDEMGNVSVAINGLYYNPSTIDPLLLGQVVSDLSTAFRYYDSRRESQKQEFTGLTQGGQTFILTGFDETGKTILNLVRPN